MSISTTISRLPGPVVFIAIAAALAHPAAAQNPPQVTSARPYLRWERPPYHNYALSEYRNYPNHTIPYEDGPRTFFGPMGDELITGYNLYAWNETRAPGLEYGSSIFKPNEMHNLTWNRVYDATVLGRDGYGNWGYSLIVADNMIARLSPLVLSMTDFNGMRFDLALPRLKLTGLASRIERPHVFRIASNCCLWMDGKTHYADDSTLLLGGRAQAELGRAILGINFANSHIYRSTLPGNSPKGVLRPDQPLIDWVIVRFSDDSPADNSGGALVQEVVLVVNGEHRPDLRPRVIRHLAGAAPQVGALSAATGRFRAVDYRLFRGHRLFYRGRDEIPLFADYFYRLDHEAGADVSSAALVAGLVANFQLEPAGEILRADGQEQLAFLFDLSGEPRVESVEVEALLGNDYRVDVATLTEVSARARNYYSQYTTTFYRTAARAAGNIRDGGNLEKVRFQVGEDTGIFTGSANLAFSMPGLEVEAEYAISALYSRYPAHAGGEPDFGASPRFSRRSKAYYLNATHWFDGGRVGAELFSTDPRFTTSYRTYLAGQPPRGNVLGMINETVYWDLVQDNDDGDRFPDRRVGNIEGFAVDGEAFDLDGVFLAQDEDKDGFPEINRDGDLVPDFEEPFLMFDVEPNFYVYGLDRNHNDEPDQREDDGNFDYPYDIDQEGLHLFAQIDLRPHLALALGRFRVDQLAGGGRNRTTYVLLTLDRKSVDGRQRIFFENNLRRVQDDIPDEYLVMNELSDRTRIFSFGGLSAGNNIGFILVNKPPIFTSHFAPDRLFYQDSYVNETYLEGRFNPWSTLDVVQKVRFRTNWQQGGRLYNGRFQLGRRLDLWTWVNRVQYTRRWGRLSLTPQYKFMRLSLRDARRGNHLRSELRSIPILRLEYALLRRTSLRAGVQGWGGLPYRRREHRSQRDSFTQRTAFVTLINRSKYFGYELVTLVGVTRDEKIYDAEFERLRTFDSWSFFARALVGFTELGRPI